LNQSEKNGGCCLKITVLGAGLVGNAIVRDLALDNLYDMVAVDKDLQGLNRLQNTCSAQVLQADLTEENRVGEIVPGSDLVINAVPGFMGFETLKRVIAAGKNVVDISFFAQDPFQLDDLAKSKGVTAVVDCGVAPGLCNALCGHLANRLDRIEHYACYVGGLPAARNWPYEYKTVFSPTDAIEEYVRPSRFIECGREVVRPALSEVELIDFPEVGTLEAFNTDGLRTLRQTMKIPNMKEKTLRYPGHANLMRTFRESGFFSPTPLQVDGQSVRPLSVVSALLFDQWKLQPGEEDFTLLKVVVDGWDKEIKRRYTYDLLDRYDPQTQTTSMARTTGYTCSIVARQVLAGKFDIKGICPPEFLGKQDTCFDDLLAGYEKRNIRLVETIT
jgi:lysine 6-dehydrogenase